MNVNNTADQSAGHSPERGQSEYLPSLVSDRMNARLAPFEVADIEHREGLSLLSDLKLMFAALGAGGAAVPLGDNSRTARLLAEYAASLHEH